MSSPPPIKPNSRSAYLRALASPARLEIVEGLQLGGASNVAELGRRLGRAPDSLYYHLRELEKAGVIERSGVTDTGDQARGRRGVVYRMLPGPVGGETPDTDDVDEREAMGEMASAVLRLTDRDVKLALTGASDQRPGAGLEELPIVQRTKAWLTAEEVGELGALLDRVDDFLRARCEPGPGERSLCSLTYALTTLVPHS